MPQALKPLCLTQVGRIPFSHFQSSSLWGNKNWAPQYKDVKVGKFREQNLRNRLQMVQFEWPRPSNPCVLPRLGEFHISHILPSFLWGNKNRAPLYKYVEVGKCREHNWLNRLQMVQFECRKYRNPCVSLTFGGTHFSHFQPLLFPFFLNRESRCGGPMAYAE